MSSGTSAAGSASRDIAVFTDLIEPIVRHLGVDLDDLTVAQVGRRRVVRVIVDSDEGVSLDSISLLSSRISSMLDEREGEVGHEPYTLEVTSPGVDRILSTERHWSRAVGRVVRASVDNKPIEGRVERVIDGAVTLRPSDADPVTVPIAQLSSGQVQVEFTRAPEAEEQSPRRAPRPKKTPKKPKKPKGMRHPATTEGESL